MFPAGCKSIQAGSNVKISDARSNSATFANPGREAYVLIRFDGCVVCQQLACDWIVEKPGVGRLAVELKGGNVDHAVEQVYAALRFLRDNGITDLTVGALIICSRYPSVDTKVQRYASKLAREFRAPLKVRTDGKGLNFDALVRFA